jgi:hypothetical protein
VPAVSALVVQPAVRVLPLPASATAEQPLIDVPPEVKPTVPVGAMPATVAVKVTEDPAPAGFAELLSVAVSIALLTNCDRGELVEALLPVPPL